MGHYIVHGRAEFETTDLGLAAYEGRTEDVRAFIQRGIDVRRRINIPTRLSAGLGEMAPLH